MKASSVPGLSVELFANGQALKEFEDDDRVDGQHNTITRYVEATPNTEFSIRVILQPAFPYRLNDMRLDVSMDGEWVTGFCLLPVLHVGEHREILSSFVANVKGVGYRRTFAFGELKTTDEPLQKSEGSELKRILSKLGEVTLSMRRVKFVGRRHPQDQIPPGPSKLSDSIPEKALKGRSISNRAVLKDAGTCSPRESMICEYPYGTEPFVRFTFKYRSRRDLQIEGIIPRSPSPAPLDELDLDSMTREEAIEALRRQREQQAPSVRVKRERAPTMVIHDDDSDDDGDEGGVSITSIAPVKKRQRTSNDSGIDLIDLTDD